jgi:transcriptional regulator
MYRHPSFSVDDQSLMRRLIAERRLGTIVVVSGGRFEASPLPWLLGGNELHGHVVNANPLVEMCAEEVPCLVIFDLADGYVSPSWYPSKLEHGKVVPTWNYVSVHVHGSVRVMTDHEWKLRQVEKLTEEMEQSRPEPWSVDDAPDSYIEKMVSSITGLVVSIDRIEAKAKLSQNRSEPDRQAVREKLGGVPPSVGITNYMDGHWTR